MFIRINIFPVQTQIRICIKFKWIIALFSDKIHYISISARRRHDCLDVWVWSPFPLPSRSFTHRCYVLVSIKSLKSVFNLHASTLLHFWPTKYLF